MIVVGIDPSLTATGVFANGIANVIKSKPRVVEGDFIDLTVARCDEIMNSIDGWMIVNHIADLGPCQFFIEGPQFKVDSKTGSHLFEMGVWYGSFIRHFGVGANTLRIVNPSVLKKFISGKGNTRKDAIPLIAYKRWGIEFENDPGYDKVHAFCLERLGHAVNDGTFDLTTAKRRGSRRKTQPTANAASGDRPVQVRRNRRTHADSE